MERQIDVVDHEIQNDVHFEPSLIEKRQPMRLDEHGIVQSGAYGLKGRIEALQMPDLQCAALFIRQCDEVVGLIHLYGHGFFQQHVNAGSQEFACDAEMVLGRGHDADGIDLAEEFPVIGVKSGTGFPRHLLRLFPVDVRHRHQPSFGKAGVLLRMEPAEISHTHHGDP